MGKKNKNKKVAENPEIETALQNEAEVVETKEPAQNKKTANKAEVKGKKKAKKEKKENHQENEVEVKVKKRKK